MLGWPRCTWDQACRTHDPHATIQPDSKYPMHCTDDMRMSLPTQYLSGSVPELPLPGGEAVHHPPTPLSALITTYHE